MKKIIIITVGILAAALACNVITFTHADYVSVYKHFHNSLFNKDFIAAYEMMMPEYKSNYNLVDFSKRYERIGSLKYSFSRSGSSVGELLDGVLVVPRGGLTRDRQGIGILIIKSNETFYVSGESVYIAK